jgi:polyhydroxyalkanoate synthesis repressor PhaR
MIRLITRYGGTSRKLYDTEESRYISLEDISAWIRAGQELKVVDRQSGEDVTAQTLAQSIYEDHRRGSALFSGEFLHQVIRRGGQAFSDGIGQVQEKVDHLVSQSLERLGPIRAAKADLALLQKRIAELEAALAETETLVKSRGGAGRPRASRRTTR